MMEPLRVLRIDVFINPSYMEGLCEGMGATKDECTRFISKRLEAQMPSVVSKKDDHVIQWGVSFHCWPRGEQRKAVDWQVTKIVNGQAGLHWTSYHRQGLSDYLFTSNMVRVLSKKNLFGEFKKEHGR